MKIYLRHISIAFIGLVVALSSLAFPIFATGLPSWMQLEPELTDEAQPTEQTQAGHYLPVGTGFTLPLYTEEELARVRGIPTHPGQSETLYLPPGIAGMEELPICPPQTIDDPSTEINEQEEEYLQLQNSGELQRKRQARVVECRLAPPENVITDEENEKWWRENGMPINPDAATDNPSSPFYQPQATFAGTNAPMAIDATATHSWAQSDLLSPASPDLKFSAITADLGTTTPAIAAGQSWNDSALFVRLVVGHNTASYCSGWGLEKIQLGVAKGKWHSTAPAITGTPQLVYAINSSTWGCVASNTGIQLTPGALLRLQIIKGVGSSNWDLFWFGTSYQLVVSTNVGWANGYARRIAAGTELYAANTNKINLGWANKGMLAHIHLTTDTTTYPWADSVLPSNYKSKTNFTVEWPLTQPPIYTDLTNYTSQIYP